VRALAHSASAAGYEAELLTSVEAVNNRQKHRLFDRISGFYDGKLKGKTIALWGLSFKPKTDDMRDAPSRVLMEALWEAGATVRAYDPEAMDETRRLYPAAPDLALCKTSLEAVDGADALAIVTEWQEFRSPDFQTLKEQLADGVIFDGRNLYDPDMVESMGLAYYGIGRGRSVDRPAKAVPRRRQSDR
jgi:UDPglucose 6-dehydrogenase